MGPERTAACAECHAPLAQDQRYCLTCGARAGVPSPELLRLVASAGESWPALASRATSGPAPAPASPAAPPPGRTAPAPGTAVLPAAAGVPIARRWLPDLWLAPAPRLPSRPVSAALVLVFLGFGILLGTVGSSVDNTLAANAGIPLRVILPASPAPVATIPSAAGTHSSGAAEPPEAEPEPTPAATPAATTRTATAPPAGSGSASEGSGSGEAAKPPETIAKKLPTIKHVFVIALSHQPYAGAFGPASTAHYLSQTLEKRGELLVAYDAVAHEELANGVALLSGQGPTAETAANCQVFSDILPGSPAASEQVLGSGCVYPKAIQTLAGQLLAHHLGARAYIEGIAEAGMPAGACAHPPLGQVDPSAAPGASTGPYATFRNPLVYFHSIIDSPSCASLDVGLARLHGDLASAAATPSFSYIVPDRCHDGNPLPCAPGAPAGMGPADVFLARVVPEILASRAYREAGLLVITVDQAPSSGEFGDSSSCCGQPRYPNLPAPAGAGRRHGGGTVGALLLSPYVKGGTTSQEKFNHFSLLRTIEDLFSLKHLGYAGLTAVKPFEPSMFLAKRSG